MVCYLILNTICYFYIRNIFYFSIARFRIQYMFKFLSEYGARNIFKNCTRYKTLNTTITMLYAIQAARWSL